MAENLDLNVYLLKSSLEGLVQLIIIGAPDAVSKMRLSLSQGLGVERVQGRLVLRFGWLETPLHNPQSPIALRCLQIFLR